MIFSRPPSLFSHVPYEGNGIKTMIGLKLYEISIAAFQQPWEFGQRLTNLPYGRRFVGAKVTSLSLLWDPSLDRSVPPDGNCQVGHSGSM